MIVAVFRARLREEARDEYSAWAKRMSAIAKSMPGYISHKLFVAEDGERVTIVEFESEETLKAWSVHPEHIEAKKLGRTDFYLEYSSQLCQVLRASDFKRPA